MLPTIIFGLALFTTIAFITDCIEFAKGYINSSKYTTPIIRILLVLSWSYLFYLLHYINYNEKASNRRSISTTYSSRLFIL